jgi:hypothetical protein
MTTATALVGHERRRRWTTAQKRRKIGEDVTEILEYVSSSFKVIEHVRPKVSCRTCATILQAPLPSFPIERGRAGPAPMSGTHPIRNVLRIDNVETASAERITSVARVKGCLQVEAAGSHAMMTTIDQPTDLAA